MHVREGPLNGLTVLLLCSLWSLLVLGQPAAAVAMHAQLRTCVVLACILLRLVNLGTHPRTCCRAKKLLRCPRVNLKNNSKSSASVQNVGLVFCSNWTISASIMSVCLLKHHVGLGDEINERSKKRKDEVRNSIYIIFKKRVKKVI